MFWTRHAKTTPKFHSKKSHRLLSLCIVLTQSTFYLSNIHRFLLLCHVHILRSSTNAKKLQENHPSLQVHDCVQGIEIHLYQSVRLRRNITVWLAHATSHLCMWLWFDFCNMHLRAHVRASAFQLWDRGFVSRYGLMLKESVNALPKNVGFLRVLRFPPTGKADRVG